ncbi:hypothetical protein [Streptomyces sp. HUAS TT20]|uniref:hypothetical protein n=1 Tax=Streptomyces sp. HUAS TT20 TaxID=3447509 RepID=UPI0021D9761C|nr:hypothetical protein [Streptomyces sp. HUAS 15-9]UXY32345.1 hypothetical protein N8I87_41540 [Streptomyces sp. HUAS 15-9]
MNREWRKGAIELVSGCTLTDADGHRLGRAEGIEFAIEGGFVNVRLLGVPYTQLVSAPAVRLITCES